MNASEILQTWFDEVWCKSNRDAIFELLAEDGEAHLLGPDVLHGPEAFAQTFDLFQATFDSIEIRVVEVVQLPGDRAFGRCAGTLRKGDKTVSLTGACICDVRDGKLVLAHNYWNFLEMLEELGALPNGTMASAFAGATFAAK